MKVEDLYGPKARCFAWKIYLWLSVAIFSFSEGVDFTTSDISAENFLELLVMYTALLGVFGYVYKLRIYSVQIWKIWTIVFFLYTFITTLLTDWSTFIQLAEPGFIAFFIPFAVVLTVPLLIALYLYSFRSPEIWEE